jgi:hypothetical protein
LYIYRQFSGERHKSNAPEQLWIGRIIAYNCCRSASSRHERGVWCIQQPNCTLTFCIAWWYEFTHTLDVCVDMVSTVSSYLTIFWSRRSCSFLLICEMFFSRWRCGLRQSARAKGRRSTGTRARRSLLFSKGEAHSCWGRHHCRTQGRLERFLSLRTAHSRFL